MSNRKWKNHTYLRNYTLKNLLSSPQQLGQLYEDFVNHITNKIKNGQITDLSDMEPELVRLNQEKLDAAEECYIQSGYD
jgi:hypothetical protein